MQQEFLGAAAAPGTRHSRSDTSTTTAENDTISTATRTGLRALAEDESARGSDPTGGQSTYGHLIPSQPRDRQHFRPPKIPFAPADAHRVRNRRLCCLVSSNCICTAPLTLAVVWDSFG